MTFKKELEDLIKVVSEEKKCPDWVIPEKINNIIPVLIISEYNYKSSAKTKFDEILEFTRTKIDPGFLYDLQTFNFTMRNGLSNW